MSTSAKDSSVSNRSGGCSPTHALPTGRSSSRLKRRAAPNEPERSSSIPTTRRISVRCGDCAEPGRGGRDGTREKARTTETVQLPAKTSNSQSSIQDWELGVEGWESRAFLLPSERRLDVGDRRQSIGV